MFFLKNIQKNKAFKGKKKCEKSKKTNLFSNQILAFIENAVEKMP